MRIIGPPLALGSIAAALGANSGPIMQIHLTQWFAYGLLALSLSLVWGHAGIFSIGQTLFFGLGGYGYAVGSLNLSSISDESLSAIVLGVVIAASLAALLGYFMFYGQVTEIYVGVITLSATLVFFTLIQATAGPTWHIGVARLGGYNGMTGIAPLHVGNLQFIGLQQMYVLLAVTVVVYSGIKVFTLLPIGRVSAGIASNPQRAELLGYDVRLTRLITYVMGGAVAGLAGGLFAASEGIVTPDVFGLETAGPLVIWVLVGGRSVLAGGILGAVIVGFMLSYVDRLVLFGYTPFEGQGPLILGVLLLVIVLALPQGVLPGLAELMRHLIPRTLRTTDTPQDLTGRADSDRAVPKELVHGRKEPASNDDGVVLESTNLSKRFGGLQALDNVSISLPTQGVRCLIGPNGAGKSTWFNILTGRTSPDAGEVLFMGVSIVREPSYLRVRKGLGIKLQIPSIFPELKTRENLWLAAYAGESRDGNRADIAASGVLQWLDLESEAPAGALPHGQQQWLEIAMVLLTHPRVVLLDEPTSGMTRSETMKMAQLVSHLGLYMSILVIEHDMEFVNELDADVAFLFEGTVLSEGSMADLRQDSRLLAAYLGSVSDA